MPLILPLIHIPLIPMPFIHIPLIRPAGEAAAWWRTATACIWIQQYCCAACDPPGGGIRQAHTEGEWVGGCVLSPVLPHVCVCVFC